MAPVATETETEVSADTIAAIDAVFEKMYEVVVHDDDVTTFDTVITALVTIFGKTPEAALELAQKVDSEGEAVAAILSEKEAEDGVAQLRKRRIRASKRPAL